MWLVRRSQLLLKNYHSLTLPPFNYSLSTNLLSFSLLCCSLHTLLLPFLLGFFTCLSLSHCLPFSWIGLFLLSVSFRQNSWGCGGAADGRNTGSAGCSTTDRHKGTLIYGICGAMCTPCMWVDSRVKQIKDVIRVLYVYVCIQGPSVWPLPR